MQFGQLASVVSELASLLPGARVDKVIQDRTEDLTLVLRAGRARFCLLLSADRTFPRIHLASRKPAAGPVPSGFLLSLRKHIVGARIGEVGLVNNDRIVAIGFSRAGAAPRLIFELFGTGSNILMTDSAGVIVAVLRQSRPDCAQRPLLPGQTYQPPPFRPRPEGDGEAADEDAGDADGPVSRTVERGFEERMRVQRTAALRQKLHASVNRLLRKAERRKVAVLGDLARAEEAEAHREAGSLILANLQRIDRGQELADLTGYDGRTVTVLLDPARSPQENADAYFRKFKKGKTGQPILRRRIAEASDAADGLRAMLAEIEQAGDLPSLEAIRARLDAAGSRGDGVLTAGRKQHPAPLPFRVVVHEGWEILIGRNARGNDHLTRELAGPDDLWLHAEGMPGSHVLVRNPGRRDIPPDVLLRAASFAAYYSKGRDSAKVPVAYTCARYVRKPRGARPGSVVLTERKTLLAVPESAERG